MKNTYQKMIQVQRQRLAESRSKERLHQTVSTASMLQSSVHSKPGLNVNLLRSSSRHSSVGKRDQVDRDDDLALLLNSKAE